MDGSGYTSKLGMGTKFYDSRVGIFKYEGCGVG